MPVLRCCLGDARPAVRAQPPGQAVGWCSPWASRGAHQMLMISLMLLMIPLTAIPRIYTHITTHNVDRIDIES